MGNLSTNIKRYFVYALVLLCIYFLIVNYNSDSLLVLIQFILIIVHCASKLFSKCYVDYGLTQIFYVFSLFFLGIAPLFQYLEHVTIWGGIPFSDMDYIETNFLIIISLFLYQFIYERIFKSRKIRGEKYIYYDKNSNHRKKNLTVLIFLTIISAIYTIMRYNFSVSSLLFRVDGEGDGVNNPLGLINSFIIRPIPSICFLFYIIRYKFHLKRKNISILEFIWLLVILLTLSPIGVPRFVVAAFYIPIAMMYLPFLKKKYNLMLFLAFALIIIFPLLDLVRRENTEYALVNGLDMLLHGHFDSYQMFMRTVSTNFVTYGKQLLGVLFFFIPRSLWPTKPVGSGYVIAHENGYYFDNVSMCYWGEGYINFGYLGVFIFAILIACFNARMDCRYWFEGGKYRQAFSIVFLITLGMEFIILRGALLNVFPAYLAFVVAVYVVSKFSSVRFIKRY